MCVKSKSFQAFEIQMNYLIQTRKPDVVSKKKKTCQIVDFTDPTVKISPSEYSLIELIVDGGKGDAYIAAFIRYLSVLINYFDICRQC